MPTCKSEVVGKLMPERRATRDQDQRFLNFNKPAPGVEGLAAAGRGRNEVGVLRALLRITGRSQYEFQHSEDLPGGERSCIRCVICAAEQFLCDCCAAESEAKIQDLNSQCPVGEIHKPPHLGMVKNAPS